jgi:uncharacterized membrane protein
MSFSLILTVVIFLIFILFWFFAYFFKRNKFQKTSLIFFISAPIISFLFTLNYYGIKIIYIFISFIIFGTLGEFCFGYLYHKIFKKKLWEYKTMKLGKNGYTSLLSVPFWGMAGLMFWGLSLLFF